MKSLTFVFLLFCFVHPAQAQKENNVWVGGDDVLIDFNSGFPVPEPRTDNQNIWRTNAAICDSDGNLLFYTNGYRIFNKNFQPMANGDHLNIGDYVQWGYDELSLHDGAAIVPMPEQPGKYYVFHEDLNHTAFDTFPSKLMPTHLFYCLVDMSLDGGNGAVVSGQRDVVVLSDTLTEVGLKVVKHGNGRDYWLLCHEATTDRFYRFLIDPQGVHGPYEQHAGSELHNLDAVFHSVMAMTQDGSRFCQLKSGETELELYDFDRCSGLLSDLQTVDVADTAFRLMGAAFSPNNRFLYVTANYWTYLYQFDLQASDIAASRQLIAVYDSAVNPFATRYDHLALAPDNKIYICTYDADFSLHVVNYPDSLGSACGFAENGLQINPPGINWSSVPNVINYSLGPLNGSGCDTLTSTKALPQPVFTFDVYPNPFTDQLQLTATGVTTKAFVSVTDMLGRQLFREVITPADYVVRRYIDLSSFASGVYVLALTTGNNRYAKVVVKK